MFTYFLRVNSKIERSIGCGIDTKSPILRTEKSQAMVFRGIVIPSRKSLSYGRRNRGPVNIVGCVLPYDKLCTARNRGPERIVGWALP